MTARTSRLIPGPRDPVSIADQIDSSLRTSGGAISLSFSDAVVHIMLDDSGDWTVTVGLSLFSDRLLTLTKTLEELGFFQATEMSGMAYHLWTSTLQDDHRNLNEVEETLLRVLSSFQSEYAPTYIS
jgi:hypothetical protein